MDSNVVVMGGSFNPPTIAHMLLIQSAIDAVRAERGYLVPVSLAYLKRKLMRAGCGHLTIPTDMRLEMLRVMAEKDARVRVYEGETHQPFSVTQRVMEEIQRMHPGARVWFVAGEDKLGLLETFVEKWDFLPRYGAIVFSRGGDIARRVDEYPRLSAFRDHIVRVETPERALGVSSTAVRERLFDPDAVSRMLDPDVLTLIRRLKRSDFPEEIISFTGEYAFLSGSYPAPVEYMGVTYPSAESAFQASKAADPTGKLSFAKADPMKARQMGARLTPYPGWEAASDGIMHDVTRLKFAGNPALIKGLMDTGDRRLINGKPGNKDRRWGFDTTIWEGDNRLGEILMEIREQLRGEIQS